MQLRKLDAAAAARLCPCGLYAHENGHRRSCPVWQAQEAARLRARIAALQARIAALQAQLAALRSCGRQPPHDRPDWRCAACQSDVFARSARDPTRCIRCVRRIT